MSFPLTFFHRTINFIKRTNFNQTSTVIIFMVRFTKKPLRDRFVEHLIEIENRYVEDFSVTIKSAYLEVSFNKFSRVRSQQKTFIFFYPP